MTLLYYDSQFLEHDTAIHPECADRLRAVWRHLEGTGLAARCIRPAWSPASDDRLLRVHDASYLAQLRTETERGGGRLDPDTFVSPASWDVACLAAGAVCDAVDRVLRGEDRTAACLVRPPGHHALRHRAMGFCLLNNIAIGAHVAMAEHGLDRVLIVDWDVHHGNATQDAFYSDPRVGFLSIHRWPFYPGTGAAEETGVGKGVGTTVNVPVPFGIPRQRYHDLFRRNLETLAEKIKPELVLVSAGFDAHREDSIGSLGLEVEDFGTLTEAVLEIALIHAAGRVISTLEGGYNPEVLARCVEAHVVCLSHP